MKWWRLFQKRITIQRESQGKIESSEMLSELRTLQEERTKDISLAAIKLSEANIKYHQEVTNIVPNAKFFQAQDRWQNFLNKL